MPSLPGQWLLAALLALLGMGCAREEPPAPRERVVAAPAEQPTARVEATGGRLSWEDEEGRPLLEVTVTSAEGVGSFATGAPGPVTLRGASCRLFEDGKPTTWLKTPVATWADGKLVAREGVTAGSIDGRMSAKAGAATWTARTKLLELTAPVCRAQQPGEPALVVKSATAQWSGGVLTLPAGARAHTSDGVTTMRARRVTWRASTGELRASGDVEVRRAAALVRSRQMSADTRIRKVRFTGAPRLEIRRRETMSRAKTLSTVILAATVPAAAGAGAVEQIRRDVPAQSLVLLADVMEGDWIALNLDLIGRASLTGPDLVMTADRMRLKGAQGGNRLASANATGNVRLQARRDEKTVITASGASATYDPDADHATLTGGIRFQLTSPRFAEPATLLGERVELVLSTGKAVVYRAEAAPVTVSLRPKGSEGPIELRANRVEMAQRPNPSDVERSEVTVTATGEPVMKHPRGTLAAERIWFELEEGTNDVRVAHAQGAVHVTAAWENGQTADARARSATLHRTENRIVLEGDVRIVQNAPGLDQPRQASGGTVQIDLTTRAVRVDRSPVKQAEIRLPLRPKPEKGQGNGDPDR